MERGKVSFCKSEYMYYFSEMLFFYLGFTKIISIILSWVNRMIGQKQDIPEKKHLTTRMQNLAWLTSDLS